MLVFRCAHSASSGHSLFFFVSFLGWLENCRVAFSDRLWFKAQMKLHCSRTSENSWGKSHTIYYYLVQSTDSYDFRRLQQYHRTCHVNTQFICQFLSVLTPQATQWKWMNTKAPHSTHRDCKWRATILHDSNAKLTGSSAHKWASRSVIPMIYSVDSSAYLAFLVPRERSCILCANVERQQSWLPIEKLSPEHWHILLRVNLWTLIESGVHCACATPSTYTYSVTCSHWWSRDFGAANSSRWTNGTHTPHTNRPNQIKRCERKINNIINKRADKLARMFFVTGPVADDVVAAVTWCHKFIAHKSWPIYQFDSFFSPTGRQKNHFYLRINYSASIRFLTLARCRNQTMAVVFQVSLMSLYNSIQNDYAILSNCPQRFLISLFFGFEWRIDHIMKFSEADILNICFCQSRFINQVFCTMPGGPQSIAIGHVWPTLLEIEAEVIEFRSFGSNYLHILLSMVLNKCIWLSMRDWAKQSWFASTDPSQIRTKTMSW